MGWGGAARAGGRHIDAAAMQPVAQALAPETPPSAHLGFYCAAVAAPVALKRAVGERQLGAALQQQCAAGCREGRKGTCCQANASRIAPTARARKGAYRMRSSAPTSCPSIPRQGSSRRARTLVARVAVDQPQVGQGEAHPGAAAVQDAPQLLGIQDAQPAQRGARALQVAGRGAHWEGLGRLASPAISGQGRTSIQQPSLAPAADPPGIARRRLLGPLILPNTSITPRPCPGSQEERAP